MKRKVSALAWWIRLIIILIPLCYSIIDNANDCDADLDKWLACNNPRVMNYLQTLGPNDLGSSLKGVTLTDGRSVLKGYRYLGEAKELSKGAHVYVFEYKGRQLAFLWVDPNGNELPLPSCPDWVSEDTYESSYVLSGDVYTWKAAQPGQGVIQVTCVKDSWLRAIRKKNNQEIIELKVDLKEEKELQKSVDQGHQPWRLDAVTVAHVAVLAVDKSVIIERCGVTSHDNIEADVLCKGTKEYILKLRKLIRQTADGIWTAISIEVQK